MMERKKIITGDGSVSLHVPTLNQTYHSRHGALTEAQYVYIQQGLAFWHQQTQASSVSVFEMGFGTGLNALLAAAYAEQQQLSIYYETLEKYPLSPEELSSMDYDQLLKGDTTTQIFHQIHQCSWEVTQAVPPFFELLKKKMGVEEYASKTLFDLIFYDAFGHHAQPELWGTERMQKCYELLRPNGVWVSYCAKGSVRRSLQEVGFVVERLPGAPGKREMLRAVKSESCTFEKKA